MKKTVIIVLVAVVALMSFNEPKKYTLTEGQVGILFQSMQISAKALPSSEVITSKEANVALQEMDSIYKVLSKQYQDTQK